MFLPLGRVACLWAGGSRTLDRERERKMQRFKFARIRPAAAMAMWREVEAVA